MGKKDRVWWTTKNEIDFIKAIGTGQFSTSEAVMSKSQIELLEGYVAGAKKRVNWEGVDGLVCIKVAEEKIKHLMSLEKHQMKGVI